MCPLQICCYNNGGDLIRNKGPNAGSIVYYNPIHQESLYFTYDAQPKADCCVGSDLCDLYYEMRVLDTCVSYVAPSSCKFSFFFICNYLVGYFDLHVSKSI